MRPPRRADPAAPGRPRSGFAALTLVAVGFSIAGCASAGPTAPPPATEAEWRALASPRPAPAPGAARVALDGVELAGQPAWSVAPASASLAVSELVAAGLLRRGDVRFVERRRFAAAVAAEDAGVPRPAGSPPIGVSEGAELLATVVWVPLPTGDASIEVRLAEVARGVVVGTRRATIPAGADLVSTARSTVGAIMAALGQIGRRPPWADPVGAAAPEAYVPSGVPPRAVEHFLEGLLAEEAWRWEPARVAYQAASGNGFFEAETALARTARLRLGGTLGES